MLEIRCADLASHYDGHRTSPHPHLVCRVCGRTIDVPDPNVQDLIDSIDHRVAGWELTQALDIYGVCPECRSDRCLGGHSESQEPS